MMPDLNYKMLVLYVPGIQMEVRDLKMEVPAEFKP